MKWLLALIGLGGTIAVSAAQGNLLWNNTSSTLISVNGVHMPANNPVSPVTTFYFGLFIAPFGTPPPADSSAGFDDPNWQYIADYTTNSTSAAGAGRLQNPGIVSVPGYPPGYLVSFMVRGWYYGALVADHTWDYFKTHPGTGYGQSEVGFSPVGGGASPTPSIWGTFSGPTTKQIDGMNIIVVPEPSGISMLIAGAFLFRLAWSRDPRKSFGPALTSLRSRSGAAAESSVFAV